MTRTPPAFAPGQRVQFAWGRGGALGTVVRHERRYVSGQRRIRVRWDETPRAPVRESVVSSLRLREVA